MNRIIILAYHSIKPRAEHSPANPLVVSPAQLEWQVSFLLCRGFAPIHPADYKDALDKGRKAFMVTFDDGYQDNYVNAAPILKRLGVPFVVFVISGKLSTSKEMDPQQEYMSWAQAADLVQEGNVIGAHTVNHLQHSSLTAEEQSKEILGSKADIESRIGCEARYYCAPFGDFPSSAHRLAKDNFQYSFLTYAYRSQYRHLPDVLSRIGIYGHDTRFRFIIKILRDRLRII